MNISDLRAEMGRCGISVPKLAKAIGISKKTLYSRMCGNTEFSQGEIAKISSILNLSGDKILSIFFASKVS